MKGAREDHGARIGEEDLMTTTTGSVPAAAGAAPRLSAHPRHGHAVEIAQGVLVALFIALVVMLLLAAQPPARSEVDLAQRPAGSAPARA